MSAPTVDQVLELALAYFAAAGIETTVGDEGLTTPDGRVFGLEPLRRRLADRDPEGWPEAVGQHFSVLLEADPEMPDTLEAAAPHLRAAVVAEADLGMFDGALMERPLVDGLGERLMMRKGVLGMTVTREVVDGWDVSHDAVWDQARDAALWDEPVHVEKFRVAQNLMGYSAVRGGRWTSTHVLAIDRHIDGRAGFGALVTVPARDEILVHEIRDDSFTDVTLAMLSHTASSYVEAPLPVGCDLFWWHDGHLDRICTPGEDRYRYIRVPEFSAMLWRLEESLAHSCSRQRRRA